MNDINYADFGDIKYCVRSDGITAPLPLHSTIPPEDLKFPNSDPIHAVHCTMTDHEKQIEEFGKNDDFWLFGYG